MKLLKIRLGFLLACFTLIINLINAQKSNEESNKVNAYQFIVQYSNESTHGLLIIHRLLELYNQELNKYVDLEGYQLNLFSNSDFPENIFVDTQHSFYATSPTEWYKKAMDQLKLLKPADRKYFSDILSEMNLILNQLEDDRYTIGALVETSDLKKIENIFVIYDALEACIIRYDDFEKLRKKLNIALIERKHQKSNLSNFDKLLKEYFAYEQTIHILFDVLRKDDMSMVQESSNITLLLNKNLLKQIKVASFSNVQNSKFRMEELTQMLLKQQSILNDILLNKSIPLEYEQYGAAYYYYNVELASTTNKYGRGAINLLNDILIETNPLTPMAFERPHFYKVIKSKALKKLEEEQLQIPVVMPQAIEGRQIINHAEKDISTKNEKFLVEIYDHEQFDHDTISLSFNGHWVLRNQLITNKPLRLYLDLLKGKDNFLVLFAENLGEKTPNTCALRYTNEKGKYNIVVLNSDFKQSEMIIIHRD